MEVGELDADLNEGVLRGCLVLLHGCYGDAGVCLCVRHVALFAFIQSKCLTYSLAGRWHSKNSDVITCSNCKNWWRRFFFSASLDLINKPNTLPAKSWKIWYGKVVIFNFFFFLSIRALSDRNLLRRSLLTPKNVKQVSRQKDQRPFSSRSIPRPSEDSREHSLLTVSWQQTKFLPITVLFSAFPPAVLRCS